MKSTFDPKAELAIVSTRDFYDAMHELTSTQAEYALVDVILKNCRIEAITPPREIGDPNGNVYFSLYLNTDDGITVDAHN